jgi:uncharacterized protein YjiS (DUF1127 family)
MAYATQTQAGSLSLLERVAEIREHAAEAYAAWRVYRNTVNELQDLSDRDLNDLGIARSQIRAIAMDAAYGQGN